MLKQHEGLSRRSALADLKFTPAVARLSKQSSSGRAERRNLPVREALVQRIRSEFEEMPGLSLTLAQAARLFGISQEAGSRILLRLIEERRLRRTGDDRYALRIEAA